MDLRNIYIDLGDAGFDFKNGVASLFDEAHSKTPGWEATLRGDVTIDAAPGIPVRFVLIYNNHVNGSGWRFYFVGYGCFQGRMKQVLKREGLSLAIDKIDALAVERIVGNNTGKSKPDVLLLCLE
jgi:hypothetical protein